MIDGGLENNKKYAFPYLYTYTSHLG